MSFSFNDHRQNVDLKVNVVMEKTYAGLQVDND